MQFEGGYRYRGSILCAVLTCVAVIATLAVAFWQNLTLPKGIALFLNLEGPVLLASAFTPTGLIPPQGGLASRLRWFFLQQGAVPVSFSQPLFYGGLLALLMASLVGPFVR